MREDSLARQKAAGIVPVDTALTPRPKEIPAWSSLSPDEQRVYAHMMEVFAGMLAYQDDQIGTVLDELGVLDEATEASVFAGTAARWYGLDLARLRG